MLFICVVVVVTVLADDDVDVAVSAAVLLLTLPMTDSFIPPMDTLMPMHQPAVTVGKAASGDLTETNLQGRAGWVHGGEDDLRVRLEGLCGVLEARASVKSSNTSLSVELICDAFRPPMP